MTSQVTKPPAPLQLPTGTVTFLFTDIEGSTKLWQEHRDAMSSALAVHDELIRQSVTEHGGVPFKSVGDAIQAAFSRAPDALAASVAAQQALASQAWGEIGSIKVRMAIHTGDAGVRDDEYVGHTLNRVARILSAGHGGQILVSDATQELARGLLPKGVLLRDLGEHPLKDLRLPEHIWQVVAPGLPSDFPPLVTLDARVSNLPAQTTAFIGREGEVLAVHKLLQQENVRLVTLTGPGGIGKTRLALEVAADLTDLFPRGLFFVGLGTVTSPELVPAQIAAAVGVLDAGSQPLMEVLQEALSGSPVLLVLDNFEQVLDAGPCIAELIAACPDLKVLVTSRVALHLSGEHEYPVPTLALPEAEQLAAGHAPDLDALTVNSAVALFVDRARSVRPDFRLTSENAEAVAEITRRLDGLPLAIELAAARIRLFPPEALLRRLDHRLQTLTGGARDRPARQQTLRAAIDWSYDLLSDDERIVFARLSVFSGGCDLEAAEEVCGGGSSPVDVLRAMEGLVDHSLVRRQDGPEGEPRFVMLETLREYATERLEERGENEGLTERHALYYARMVVSSDVRIYDAPEPHRMWAFDEERDNLRFAFEWCGSHGHEMALLMGRTLWMYWFMRGQVDELSVWLDDVQTRAGQLPPEDQASTLTAAALAADGLYDQRGDEWFERAAALRRALGDASSKGDELQRLGWRAQQAGQSVRAASLLEESLAAYDAVGRVPLAEWARYLLVHSLEALGDYGRAEAVAREGLAIAEERDNTHESARWTWFLGREALLRGDCAGARPLLDRSLEMRERLADQYCTSESRFGLAALALVGGDLDQAQEIGAENLEAVRRLHHRDMIAWHYALLGAIAVFRGDLDTARRDIREGLGFSTQIQQRAIRWYVQAELAWGAAGVAAANGDAPQAARLGGAAMALFHAAGRRPAPSEQARYDRYLEPVRDRMGDSVWHEAWVATESLEPEGVTAEVRRALA